MSDEQQVEVPPTRPANPVGHWLASYPLVVSFIALNIVVFLVELGTGGITGSFDRRLYLDTDAFRSQPWSVLTTLFVHVDAISLLVAVFSLFSAGPTVERALGHGRFAAVYLISGLAGGVVTVLTSTGPVAGAGPATLGLLGALAIIYWKAGAPAIQVVRLIGINLVINVVIVSLVGGLGWVGAVGGLVVGALLTLIYALKPIPERPHLRGNLVISVVIVLVFLVVVKVGLY